jgi:choline dehydrogenase-like flavoprotein
MFGGTTNHWSGSCGPLDPMDFEVRPWVPYSGWPLSRDELDPYYAAAQRYCELGPNDYSAAYWSERLSRTTLLADSNRVTSAVAQRSPPTVFGLTYREDLARAENVRVMLHANVVHIAAEPGGTRIESVQVRVLGGEDYTIRARIFVLATGGIENARLLLTSNDVHAAGLGNANGLVGRFFMDHPVVKAAFLLTDENHGYDFYSSSQIGDYSVNGHFKISESTLRERHLTNVRMPLIPQDRFYLSEGIGALHELGDDLGNLRWPDNLARHVWDVITDLDMVLEGVWRQVITRRGLFSGAREFGGFLVDTMMEQTPDPDSRVKLTEGRDALGLQRVALDWRLLERDKENVWACARILGAEVGRAGLGRVRILSQYDRVFGPLLNFGCHHMGTTRAATSPRSGVVDGDLRVHGLSNFYIAGSSVFPTGGHVPPTLTVVALTIRLAAHLKSVIGQGQ